MTTMRLAGASLATLLIIALGGGAQAAQPGFSTIHVFTAHKGGDGAYPHSAAKRSGPGQGWRAIRYDGVWWWHELWHGVSSQAIASSSAP